MGARPRRFSTRTTPAATRPTTPRRSRPPARPSTSSTACSTTRRTSTSSPITRMAVGCPTTCSGSRISSASGSPRASPTSPSAGFMRPVRPRPGLPSRRSLPAIPTTSASPRTQAHHRALKRITAHWDDVLRLATSVRTGVISASLMLKRLGAYPRQNGLALALREIGRIERTLYTPDWLEQPSLRRQATVELNKGESRNALARAVCFHRLGRLRDRTAEAQQHRASGLALVTAAIALWNTVYLGRARDALRRRGEAVPNALLAHLAPLGWQHINLTGDYLWGADPNLGPDGFRPLRGTSANPALIDAA